MKKTIHTYKLLLIGFVLIVVTNTAAQSTKCPSVKNICSIITKFYPAHLENNQPVKSSESTIEIQEDHFDNNGILISTQKTSVYEDDNYETIWTYTYKNGKLTSIKEESKINNLIIPEDTKEKVVKSTNANGLPSLITDKENKVKWIYHYENCLEVKREYALINNKYPNHIRELKYNQKNELIKEISIDNTFGHKASATTYSQYKYNNQGDWVQRLVTDRNGYKKLEIRKISYLSK